MAGIGPDADGRVHRTRFELGLWFAARDALRVGRLFRPIGRRYADPAGFLMPAARWQADRLELAVTFGRPLDADERLAELSATSNMRRAACKTQSMRVTACASSATILSSPSPTRCRRAPPPCGCVLPGSLMPRVDITDVLAEVERWIGFTGQLTHAGGATPRLADLQQHLHAALPPAA